MRDEPDIVKELREAEKKGKLKSYLKKDEKKSENKKKKILIVDDDSSIRRTVKSGFDRLDLKYKVVNAENGKECLKKLKTESLPDLILLDVMMPEMNGWDVAAEIKKNSEWSTIPIIFLTAKADSHTKNYAKILSDDFITKPFEITDLKKRIEYTLKKK